MIKTTLPNLLLRSLTLLSKFILMFFMARYMAPEDLGIYGLMTVTISISLYFLGMDFYIFNTRELLAQEEQDRGRLVRDQIVFHLLVYVFVLPLLLFIFAFGFLSWKYVGWFYALLVLEHLAQEANRLFITLSRPMMANVVLFLRSGIWVYAVLVVIITNEHARNLKIIWFGWILGLLLCLILSAYALRYLDWHKSWKHPVDWNWIRSGVLSSLPFLGSTIALKGIEYADRYFILIFSGEAIVGVYTFYINITNIVQIFVSTGIIMILYPEIIKAYQDGEMEKYRFLMRRLCFGTIGGSVILSFVVAIGIQPIILLINKQIYMHYLTAYWVLLISGIVSLIGQIPHYALYVRRKDGEILLSTIIALVAVLIMNILLVPKYGITGAAYSTLAGIIIMVSIKSAILAKIRFLADASQ